jgi:hypothetical protein
MGLTPTTLEGLTEAITQDAPFSGGAPVWVSLHSADPGATGLHEVTSGVLDQGRQEPTFAGSSGIDTLVAALSFVLAAKTVTWIGYWTAQTGGTFLGGFPLVGAGTIAAGVSGTASLVAPTHGLSITNVVRLFTMPGPAASAIPAGLAADTRYWVVAAPDANHVSLAASLGGSPIAPSSNGAFGMYVDAGEYNVSGLLTFPASTGITYATAS